MSTSTLSLVYATQQVNIYLRSIIFVFGLASNILNIIVFLSLKIFRESSCAFYLTAMSFVNIGQMFLGLIIRTLSVGFGVDWTITSLAFCKLRYYFFLICAVLSFTCMCLATSDQYLATCSNPRWQRYSNIKLARWLFIIFSIIWIFHGIPIILFYNQVQSIDTNQTVCTITNSTFEQYYRYFYLVILLGVIPAFVTIVFGIMAYRNVQHLSYRTVPLVRRETDKQLTTMVLVQDVYNLFFIVPYVVVYFIALSLSDNVDPVYAAKIQLASAITNALYYMSFSVSSNYLALFCFILIIAYLEWILYLCLRIRTISSTISLCTLQASFKSMSTRCNKKSNST
jgi:hypothetical protein